MAYLQLELSVANNSANSTVTANLYICDTQGGWNHWSPPGSITIDGTTYSFNHSFDQYQSKQWIGSAQNRRIRQRRIKSRQRLCILLNKCQLWYADHLSERDHQAPISGGSGHRGACQWEHC